MKEKKFKGKTFGLIGYGQLGKKIANRLCRYGYQVIATQRRRQANIHSQQLKLVDFNIYDDYKVNLEKIENQMKYIDHAIVTIPFKRDLKDPWVYYQGIKKLLIQLKRTHCQTIIFTSSTSVYCEDRGIQVSEGDGKETATRSERSKVLYECEKELLKATGMVTLIMRLGGILRGHLIKKINRNHYINLIEEEKIVNFIIQYSLLKSPFQSIVNIVRDQQVKNKNGKIVSNKKAKKIFLQSRI